MKKVFIIFAFSYFVVAVSSAGSLSKAAAGSLRKVPAGAANHSGGSIKAVMIPQGNGKAGLIETSFTPTNGRAIQESIVVPPTEIDSKDLKMFVEENLDTRQPQYSILALTPFQRMQKLDFNVQELNGVRCRVTSKSVVQHSRDSISKMATSHQPNGVTKLVLSTEDGPRTRAKLDLLFPANTHVLHYQFDRIENRLVVYKLEDGAFKQASYELAESDLSVKRKVDRYLTSAEVDRLGFITKFKNPASKSQVSVAGHGSRGMKVEAAASK